jgi:Fe-S-cluster-containing hydrogenase component 2
LVRPQLHHHGVAQVNTASCIGCGVCIPTCDTEAVALVQRGEINPPPDVEKFCTVRYKAEQGV